MLRLGAIDVGTNSCRMLIADHCQGRYQEIKQALITTRLGEGVARKGVLKKEAIERTLKAIEVFLQVMKKAGVDKIGLVGTSALREVSNADILLNKLKEAGLNLKIISGQEEARLVLKGVSLELDDYNLLTIDIGGGSTEFIWRDKNQINYQSLKLGAVRLTEMFLSHPERPIIENELNILEKYISSILKELNYQGDNLSAIGVGGTITTLTAIDLGLKVYDHNQIHRHRLKYNRVKKILTQLSGQSLMERQNILGLEPERADIIIAGTVILKVIMEQFSLQEITCSEQGLLYGIVSELG
jgi:exopolyphosphatase / guanosine-5'-triphosphate,3'-diphosphate pyrophosphatase